jgi:4-amino-4-deoxy-L-arabinose transferase-like glycosyltransferase
MDHLLTRRVTLVLVALLTLWRLYLAASLQLHPDEAYYWLWARRLDYGYYDHAPMVAYFIRLGTLWSQAEVWVRITGVLTPVVLSAILWRMAVQMFESQRVAAATVLLFNVSPWIMLGMLVMTPDIPLLLFWGLGVYLLWEIVRTGRTGLWYWLGLVYGLALLSKYTAVLLGPCVLLFLLLSKEERRWLKTPHPYLAVLLGLAVFSPVMLWNSQHDWISFRFQVGHGLSASDSSWLNILVYIAGQCFLTSPVGWVAGVVVGIAAAVRRNKAALLLACTSLPVIAFFGYTSYRSLAGANWPAMVYTGFSVLTGAFWLVRSRARTVLWWLTFTPTLILSLFITVHTRFAPLPERWIPEVTRQNDGTNFLYDWRDLAQHLQDRPGPKPDFLLVSSHQLAAELLYYGGEDWPVVLDPHSRVSQFNFWPQALPAKAQRGLAIWPGVEDPMTLGCFFSRVEEQPNFDAHRGNYSYRRYHLVEGELNQVAGRPLEKCVPNTTPAFVPHN